MGGNPDIFQAVKSLNLPRGSFVVVGGGVLVALGMLSWDEDVDICVSQEVFEACKQQGWSVEAYHDETVLKHGIYDMGVKFGDWRLEDLVTDALTIEGVPFISLKKITEWKRKTARPKDLVHIALIETYQQSHKS